MNLIISLQNMATPFITFILTVFDFLGQNSCFVLIFAIIFLFVKKEAAFKYLLSYQVGFALGSLALKNIVKRVRPYEQNQSLLSTRASYGYSLPNEKTALASTSSVVLYSVSQNKTKGKSSKITWLSLVFLLICALVCLSQLYFAEAFLLDTIVGLGIGLVVTIIIFKFANITKTFLKISLIIILPILAVIFAFVANQSFTSNFQNSGVFEFVGVSLSLTLGCYLENKFIKYQPKNNLIFTSFKLSIMLITLIGYYYLCKLLPGIVIFSFIKFCVVGFIITILLPLIFKKLEKYFYIFAPNICTEKVTNSYITLSEKQTKKVANKILKTINLGDCILLEGDLGAGKSVLVRQILTQSGVTKHVTSPTFTLVNEYFSVSGHFYHFDMYRLVDEEEAHNIGFEEILEDKNAIKFIEWPQKVQSYLPKSYKKITIVKLSKKIRNIIVENISL